MDIEINKNKFALNNNTRLILITGNINNTSHIPNNFFSLDLDYKFKEKLNKLAKKNIGKQINLALPSISKLIGEYYNLEDLLNLLKYIENFILKYKDINVLIFTNNLLVLDYFRLFKVKNISIGVEIFDISDKIYSSYINNQGNLIDKNGSNILTSIEKQQLEFSTKILKTTLL